MTKTNDKKNDWYMAGLFVIIVVLFVVFGFEQAAELEAEPIIEPRGESVVAEVIVTEEPTTAATEEYTPTMIVEKEHDYGLFETTLHSVGWFTQEDGSVSFRADISVVNAGDDTEDFSWGTANLEKISVDKWMVTTAEFDGSDIPSGEGREGYLLFNGVPTDLRGDVILVVGSSVGYNSVLNLYSKLPHTYELTLE